MQDQPGPGIPVSFSLSEHAKERLGWLTRATYSTRGELIDLWSLEESRELTDRSLPVASGRMWAQLRKREAVEGTVGRDRLQLRKVVVTVRVPAPALQRMRRLLPKAHARSRSALLERWIRYESKAMSEKAERYED